MILTDAELVALTDCTQAAAQRRWLDEHKWPYEIGRSGRPKVARSFFEDTLGPRAEITMAIADRGPDLAALDRLIHKR